MKRLTITALLGGALLVGATPATGHVWRQEHRGARAHRRGGRRQNRPATLTFTGSCDFSGTVQFAPPLTTTPQTVSDYAYASGTCSGTLANQAGHTYDLSSSPVGYLATDQGSDDSCGAGPASTGSGEFLFRQGKLQFGLSESRVGGTAQLRLTGAGGGSAQGEADSTANPVDTAQDCASGGLSQAPVDIDIQTTPAIAG